MALVRSERPIDISVIEELQKQQGD
jgi:hypothetical protein